MDSRRWLTLVLVACALSSGCARGEPRVASPAPPPPRVVPKGSSGDELLEAANWRLEGFPAMSRDGRHVATVLVPSWGYLAIVDEVNPNFDEPNGVTEVPNSSFVVVDARTGAVERSELLFDAGELRTAQEHRSKSALAATVRGRLAAADRVLAAGGYTRMPSVRFNGPGWLRASGPGG